MVRALLALCVVVAAAFAGTADTAGVSPQSLTVNGAIREMKADQGRAIVLVEGPILSTKDSDCALRKEQRVQILAWSHSTRKTSTVFEMGGCIVDAENSVYGIAIGADNAAYVRAQGGLTINTGLYVKSLTTGRRALVAYGSATEGYFGNIIANPQADGALLAYNEQANCGPQPESPCPAWIQTGLVQEVVGATVSDEIHLALPQRRLVANSDHTLTLLAVGGGRLVVREQAGPLLVLEPQRVPSVVATYQYKPNEISAASTDGRTLAVLRRGVLDLRFGNRLRTVLEVIPLPGSQGTRAIWQLPDAASYGPDRPVSCGTETPPCAGYELRLTDVDGDLAVYVHKNTVVVMDLTTGKTATVARPAKRPVNAQLERDGLYVAAGNTLTFSPRAQVERQLGR